MKTNRIVRAWIWLRRIGHCRGFGIQSPWAYSLVRYVINEHFPYYAYADLDAGFPGADAVRRKTGRFFLRHANYVQPATVVSILFDDDEEKHSRAHFKAGCRRLEYIAVSTPEVMEDTIRSLQEAEGRKILHVNASSPAVDAATIKRIAATMREGDFMVVDNLNASPRLWDEILDGMEHTVSFDMYYCGLIYADPKRYKQNYIINF